MIQRRILYEERKRSHDASDVAKADYPSSTDTTVYMAVEIHKQPT